MQVTTPIPLGQQSKGTAVKIAVAATGVVAATLVILLGAVYPTASWLFLLLGVTLSATSVRAARRPGLLRAGTAAINLAVVPMLLSYF
jgi:predicted Na+-dependent transporter